MYCSGLSIQWILDFSDVARHLRFFLACQKKPNDKKKSYIVRSGYSAEVSQVTESSSRRYSYFFLHNTRYYVGNYCMLLHNS
jgi:hypothetical protein